MNAIYIDVKKKTFSYMLKPRHTGPRRDHGDLGNPPDRRVIAGY